MFPIKQEARTKLTRRRIIAAAVPEFAAKGYAAASLNAICAQNLSKGLVYHNYKGKDDLYIACVTHCFSDFLSAFRAAGNIPDLGTYMSVRLKYFREHPQESRIIFEALLRPPAALAEEIAAARHDFDEFNRACFQSLIARLTLRPGVTPEDAANYFTIMQSLFNLHFGSTASAGENLPNLAAEHEKTLPKMLDLMLYGIVQRSDQ